MCCVPGRASTEVDSSLVDDVHVTFPQEADVGPWSEHLKSFIINNYLPVVSTEKTGPGSSVDLDSRWKERTRVEETSPECDLSL